MQIKSIQVKGLQKSYKQHQVLKGVDFEVEKGSIFALLGSNGAGKTTVVKILTTLLEPDGGTASISVWRRDFPARDGKKPKMARPTRSDERKDVQEQRQSISGTTGERLREEMLAILGNYAHDYGEGSCDAILLIDDADCEFSNVEEWKETTDRLKEEITVRLGRSVPFYYLMESPEVEAWFLADWERSFGAESVYRKIPGLLHQIRKYLKDDLLELAAWDELEWFGGPRKGDSCTRKISSIIQYAFELRPDGKLGELIERHQDLIQALANMSNPEDRLAYSKDSHGGAMLGRIEPNTVASCCRDFFAPVYRQLSAL